MSAALHAAPDSTASPQPKRNRSARRPAQAELLVDVVPRGVRDPMRPNGIHWRPMLRELADHGRRGYSELRDRERNVLAAIIGRADTRTGRVDASAGWLAKLAGGVSLVTFYRAIERLRDDRSFMPPHKRRKDDAPERLEPLGLVRVERTFPSFALCALSKRACDAKHRDDAKRTGKRGPGCVAHHGRVTLWLMVTSVAELRAKLDGQAQHPAGRSVNRGGAENSARPSLKPSPENSHSGSVPRSVNETPPPSPEGSRHVSADVPGILVAREASNDAHATTQATVDGEPGRGPAPAGLEPQSDPQTSAVESGRARRVPARLRADALELAAIVAGWTEGKPPMLEALANRHDEGATLDELALCVESLRGSSQDAIFAKRRAHAPAAVVFATLESVRRFAAAGRSVRARREQREAWERQSAENDRAFAARRPSSSPPPDLARELAELVPMTPPPPPPMGPAEIARRRAEQLEILQALASGELVDVPIVGDVK